jgi:hypothetical protein
MAPALLAMAEVQPLQGILHGLVAGEAAHSWWPAAALTPASSRSACA